MEKEDKAIKKFSSPIALYDEEDTEFLKVKFDDILTEEDIQNT